MDKTMLLDFVKRWKKPLIIGGAALALLTPVSRTHTNHNTIVEGSGFGIVGLISPQVDSVRYSPSGEFESEEGSYSCEFFDVRVRVAKSYGSQGVYSREFIYPSGGPTSDFPSGRSVQNILDECLNHAKYAHMRKP